MQPIIMTASICGREKSKEDSPYLPTTTDEIIADGIKSYRLGVPQLHIHARDKNGLPTYTPEVFGAILDTFKANCPNVILQISTGGTYHKPQELLIPLLKLQPDLASLALQENKEDNISLAKLFYEHNVQPIVECFTLDKVREACRMFEEGYFKAPFSVEFLLDDKDSEKPFSAYAEELLEFSRICSAHDGIVWSFCRGADKELPLQSMGIALGGHLRTGLEDNLKNADGSYVKESVELIKPAMDMAKLLNRQLADIQQARKILGV